MPIPAALLSLGSKFNACLRPAIIYISRLRNSSTKCCLTPEPSYFATPSWSTIYLEVPPRPLFAAVLVSVKTARRLSLCLCQACWQCVVFGQAFQRPLRRAVPRQCGQMPSEALVCLSVSGLGFEAWSAPLATNQACGARRQEGAAGHAENLMPRGMCLSVCGQQSGVGMGASY